MHQKERVRDHLDSCQLEYSQQGSVGVCLAAGQRFEQQGYRAIVVAKKILDLTMGLP